jgi:hypothetical protein
VSSHVQVQATLLLIKKPPMCMLVGQQTVWTIGAGLDIVAAKTKVLFLQENEPDHSARSQFLY